MRQPEPPHAAQKQPGSLGVVHAVQMSSYAGPLPHPDILRQFEEIVPGAAERIFTQFEEQSAHRRAMEAQVIRSNAFSQRLGSISASLIGILGVGGGIWLTYAGKNLAGLASVIATLAALTGVYLAQQAKQSKERQQKKNSGDTRGAD